MVNVYISTLKRIIILILISLFTACSSYDAALRDTAGNTLLHYAVFSGDIIQVKKIINSGADVNLPNNYGLTPLRCAAALNNRDIMDLLLENGACTNYRSPYATRTAGRGLKKNYIYLTENYDKEKNTDCL